jgi:predicted DNA-binding ribbon-helix-helix protein
MTFGPVKHSLTLNGHRTSVSLEPEFWQVFCDIAAARGMSVNALAAELDQSRQGGLASALRVFVLAQTLGGFTPQVLPIGKTSPQDI